jgi:hypothetical protein
MRTQHGVAPRTIRNIWNRRTWVEDTLPHWTAEQREEFLQLNKAPSIAPISAGAVQRPRVILTPADAVEIYQSTHTAANLAAKVKIHHSFTFIHVYSNTFIQTRLFKHVC